MNGACNDEDHSAINAERAETRELRRQWVKLSDENYRLRAALEYVLYNHHEGSGEFEEKIIKALK